MYMTIFNEKEMRKKKEKFSKNLEEKMYALMYDFIWWGWSLIKLLLSSFYNRVGDFT